MQKWEYICLKITEKDHIINLMNRFGSEGWDLVSTNINVDEILCFFKRPVTA